MSILWHEWLLLFLKILVVRIENTGFLSKDILYVAEKTENKVTELL